MIKAKREKGREGERERERERRTSSVCCAALCGDDARRGLACE